MKVKVCFFAKMDDKLYGKYDERGIGEIFGMDLLFKCFPGVYIYDIEVMKIKKIHSIKNTRGKV